MEIPSALSLVAGILAASSREGASMGRAKTRPAILVEDDYEELGLWYPAYRMREADVSVTIVGSRRTRFTSRFGEHVGGHQSGAHALQPSGCDQHLRVQA